MVRVGMVSYWHVHAPDYTRQLQESGRCQFVGVYDEIPQRGKEWAQKLQVPYYEDLDALLAREDLDAVVVDAPTSRHEEIMTKAARAGKHIFTEKVLCATLEEARRTVNAIREAGVAFVISFPHRTMPANLFVKEVVDSGRIGTPTYMRMRNAHNGTVGGWLPPHFYDARETCGGAMIDLGAHPMYLTGWILGTPATMASTFTQMANKGVEDNAVSVMTYRNGAIAVAETGFMTPASPSYLEVQGTEGTVLVQGLDQSVWLRERGSEAFVRVENLPAPGRSAMEQFLDAVERGEPVTFGLEDALQLSALMDAAYRSHAQGRTVEL